MTQSGSDQEPIIGTVTASATPAAFGNPALKDAVWTSGRSALTGRDRTGHRMRMRKAVLFAALEI